ncbi:hypothetical protein AABB24_015241 [Solanum stoloniferum]|uniref:F-box associated domain-containing protein n=1 Tax=Solanum stoloniferum TaxID=62892 RepID=A0ABD2TNU1_9SOLN
MQLLEPMLEKVYDFTNYGVSILGGKLCFYCAHCAYSNPRESTFMLWLMKDYSVKESWILSYTIQDNYLFFLKPIQEDKDLLDLFFLRPIHMFADGEVLLNYRCIDYVGSNLPFRISKGPFGLWPENNTLIQGIIYTESLISPKSFI